MADSSNEQSRPSVPHRSDSSALSQNATPVDGASPRSTKGQFLFGFLLFGLQAMVIDSHHFFGMVILPAR